MAQHDADRSLRLTLHRLRRELDADLTRLEELRALRDRREEIDELRADLDRQLERAGRAAVITLVGATGAGKSTLLNALVGRSVAVEGETRPTTSQPVIYRPRDADLGSLLDGLPGERPRVVDYDPSAGGPWSEQVLIDAPDTNSVATEHRQVVRALAERSDVLVVVAHRQSIAELGSVSFVDLFARRRSLLFVLNRADELSAESREELVEQLRGLAVHRWGAAEATVVATSALRARQQPETPGWEELCDALARLAREGELGRVRRHNALGVAARLADVGRELREAVEPELHALESDVTEGLAAWCESVRVEATRRLELREAELRRLLCEHVASRWDGPGGWALRAGGLGTLGLGAGALIARRNPLLAAGAAAGALAASKAQRALVQHRLRDERGLLPESGELEIAYRTRLSKSRLRALRLVEDPASLALASEAELSEGAAGAVADGWDRLLGRELLEEAGGLARWFLKLPIDLPVIAFVAWIVVQSVRGFFGGNYLGLDFLLNAGLLLVVWLLLARFAVRALAGLRIGRLLRRAVEDLRRRLEGVAAQGTESFRRRAEETREALERLATLDRRWRIRLTGEPGAGKSGEEGP